MGDAGSEAQGLGLRVGITGRSLVDLTCSGQKSSLELLYDERFLKPLTNKMIADSGF